MSLEKITEHIASIVYNDFITHHKKYSIISVIIVEIIFARYGYDAYKFFYGVIKELQKKRLSLYCCYLKKEKHFALAKESYFFENQTPENCEVIVSYLS